MALGPHKLEYEVIEGWERLPEGYAFTEIVGVAVDSRDRVYVFNRGDPPVIVFDKEGLFLDAWGAGQFVRPHGAYISRDDRLFLVDDWGHTVYVFSTDGHLLSRIGDGEPADTGYQRGATPVARAAGPFNTVTNVAVNMEADGVPGPLGMQYSREEGFWQVTVFPQPVELVGGADDGQKRIPGREQAQASGRAAAPCLGR